MRSRCTQTPGPCHGGASTAARQTEAAASSSTRSGSMRPAACNAEVHRARRERRIGRYRSSALTRLSARTAS